MKSYVADRSVSVPMTLSDLERLDVKGQTFKTDPRNTSLPAPMYIYAHCLFRLLFLSIISTAYHLLSGSRAASLLLNWLKIDWMLVPFDPEWPYLAGWHTWGKDIFVWVSHGHVLRGRGHSVTEILGLPTCGREKQYPDFAWWYRSGNNLNVVDHAPALAIFCNINAVMCAVFAVTNLPVYLLGKVHQTPLRERRRVLISLS